MFVNLLDLIFPKRCVACGKIGSYLCSADKKKIKPAPSFCPVCLRPSIGGTTHARCKKAWNLDGLVCLFHYSSPVREMIYELKYRLVRDIQEALLQEIGRSSKLKEIEFFGFTLVSVPLSNKKQNYRGFNQSEIIGRRLAKSLKITFDPTVLHRVKDTKPQVKLSREQRLRQARFAFQAERIIDGDYLLLDDVWTTGATMKAAATALKRKGARRVWGLVLATPKV